MLQLRRYRVRPLETGGRAVPLVPSAVRLLTSLPRDEDNPWVIASRKQGWHLTNLQHPWRRIRTRAGLDGVRIHDLCHTFASRAPALGETLPVIGKLLGYTQVQCTVSTRIGSLNRGPVRICPSRMGGFRSLPQSVVMSWKGSGGCRQSQRLACGDHPLVQAVDTLRAAVPCDSKVQCITGPQSGFEAV